MKIATWNALQVPRPRATRDVGAPVLPLRIRTLMLDAAIHAGHDPDRISFVADCVSPEGRCPTALFPPHDRDAVTTLWQCAISKPPNESTQSRRVRANPSRSQTKSPQIGSRTLTPHTMAQPAITHNINRFFRLNGLRLRPAAGAGPDIQARLHDYVRRMVWHIAACAGSPVRTAFQHNEADHSRRRMDGRVGYLDDSRRMSVASSSRSATFSLSTCGTRGLRSSNDNVSCSAISRFDSPRR